MTDLTLLGISGALRKGSTNTRLLHEAARHFEPAEFTIADLRLPLYDGDLEDAEGIPKVVQTLSDQIGAADAVVISTPEYNQSLPGVLKNALDWVSRTKASPWLGKPVVIMSAAAGRSGGARSSYALRLAMTSFRPLLVPAPDIGIAGSSKAFDDDGRLVNDASQTMMAEAMQMLRKAAEAAR